MKTFYKKLSLFLAIVMLCAALPAASFSAKEASGDEAAISGEPFPPLEYTKEFKEAVYDRFYYYKKNNIVFTESNLKDYITVYHSDSSCLIFKIIANYQPSKQLINGYMFYADPKSETGQTDAGYYIYYPGKERFNSIYDIDYAVKLELISVETLAKLIPGTKKMTEQDYIEHFKSFGYDVTNVVDLGDNIFYAANENELQQKAEEIERTDLIFHINKSSLNTVGDQLGLFRVVGDNVYPLEKYAFYGVNSVKLLDNIRKAENNGVEFGFTAEFKFGKRAEDCLRLLGEEFNSYYHNVHMTSFWEIDDFCLFTATTGADTCLAYNIHIGNYLFDCLSQTEPYDLGLYIVSNGKCYFLENAYDENVIDDEDMDKIVEKLNKKSITKLSPLELKFIESRVSERRISYGFNDHGSEILTELGGAEDWKLYYVQYMEGKGITNYGDYKITWGSGEWDYPLSLYIYRNGEFSTIEQAWQDGVLNSGNIETVVKLLENTELVKRGTIEITFPDGSSLPKPTELPASTAPATEASAKSTNATDSAPTICPVLKKSANPVKLTTKQRSVKAKKLRTKKLTVKPLTIKNAQGKVAVSLVKKGTSARLYKKLKVNNKGAITLKKGKYKKGTYKIKLKITAKGNSFYNPKTITKTVKIKVK